jgi:DNA-binding MarR family transcriptional regulator
VDAAADTDRMATSRAAVRRLRPDLSGYGGELSTYRESWMSSVDFEALPHRLATGLARVAVAMHLAADDPAAGLERTLAQQQLLLLLSRRRDGYALADLAADAGMTAAATESAIGTLVREGLVVMRPAASAPDVLVRITDQGRAQAPELLHWASDLLAELRNLDEVGQRQLLHVVTDHIRRLQQQGQIPVVKMCLTCRFFDGYAHPGAVDPHHCRLVDAPFGHQLLRLRCPEQEPAVGRPRTP